MSRPESRASVAEAAGLGLLSLGLIGGAGPDVEPVLRLRAYAIDREAATPSRASTRHSSPMRTVGTPASRLGRLWPRPYFRSVALRPCSPISPGARDLASGDQRPSCFSPCSSCSWRPRIPSQ